MRIPAATAMQGRPWQSPCAETMYTDRKAATSAQNIWWDQSPLWKPVWVCAGIFSTLIQSIDRVWVSLQQEPRSEKEHKFTTPPNFPSSVYMQMIFINFYSRCFTALCAAPVLLFYSADHFYSNKRWEINLLILQASNFSKTHLNLTLSSYPCSTLKANAIHRFYQYTLNSSIQVTKQPGNQLCSHCTAFLIMPHPTFQTKTPQATILKWF